MSRRKKNTSVEESLDEFEQEEDGFIDGEIDSGNAIASFSFNMCSDIKKSDMEQPNSLFLSEPISTKNTQASNTAMLPKGLTPPVDGEQFTVKRCYQFRPSTLRKLNELKAKNPDFNIYLNTILDTAILHYYDYVFNSSKSTDNT